jgi:hypothetical protein
MGTADSYYFDVNWEVCARCGEKFLFFKDRIRSAVRIIDQYYYLAGPDLKSRPEFSEPDEGWRELIHYNFTSGNDGANRDKEWRLPGEPRAVFANFGKRMNTKFHLYELWEDSGLVIKESGWSCLEPVMYNHACRTLLDLVAGPDEKPDLFFGTGRLCVKRKTPEPETVLNSIASFTGRLNCSGHVNIYFESNRPDEKSTVIKTGTHSRDVSILADSGLSPLCIEPLYIQQEKQPGAFLSAFEGDKRARISDETQVKKFFTRFRQEDRNSLSSFLWIMGS